MKPLLLVVDDDPGFLESTRVALNSLGQYKVLTAGNAAQAFRILRKKAVDVLIVDYLLGPNSEYNGDGIIRVIREGSGWNTRTREMPCILVTGSEGEEQIRPELMNLNARYIKKADRMADRLVELIEDCICRRRATPPSVPVLHESHTLISSPWRSGSFYLFGAIVILIVVAAAAQLIAPYQMALAVAATVVLVVVVGGLQLKNDERLKDETFLNLMVIALKRLFPFLGKHGPRDGSCP